MMQQFDKAGFEKLFREEFKGLCFMAWKYVKDHDIAKEIVQESFISLWEKRAGIDPGRSVKSYLITAIRNKCYNYLRDNRKFDKNLLEAEKLTEPVSNGNADLLIEKELRQEIDIAIGELPDKCREIFLLNRYENLRYQQIADKLGISVKTVEAQMSKALQHLRLKLSGYLSLWIVLVALVRLLMTKN